MNTTKCRKYKVAKEGTYVFPRYGLKIPLSLNDEYAIVGYTRHKNETCCILQKANNPKSAKFPLRKCELEKHFTECRYKVRGVYNGSRENRGFRVIPKNKKI